MIPAHMILNLPGHFGNRYCSGGNSTGKCQLTLEFCVLDFHIFASQNLTFFYTIYVNGEALNVKYGPVGGDKLFSLP